MKLPWSSDSTEHTCKSKVTSGKQLVVLLLLAIIDNRILSLLQPFKLGEGNGNPLQYSCLENPMDRGAWWATVHGVAKSRTRLSDLIQTYMTDFLVVSLSGPVVKNHLSMQGIQVLSLARELRTHKENSGCPPKKEGREGQLGVWAIWKLSVSTLQIICKSKTILK